MRKTTVKPASLIIRVTALGRLGALAGLALAAILVAPVPAHATAAAYANAAGYAGAAADPVCAGASVTGTLTGDHHVNHCVPYSGGVLCTRQRAGIDPLLLVEVRACAPLL